KSRRAARRGLAMRGAATITSPPRDAKPRVRRPSDWLMCCASRARSGSCEVTMFEHFCVLLLRLYPAEFRRAYGGDAVQLMRDRARHERGAFRRVRLVIDLTIDLGALSLHS